MERHRRGDRGHCKSERTRMSTVSCVFKSWQRSCSHGTPKQAVWMHLSFCGVGTGPCCTRLYLMFDLMLALLCKCAALSWSSLGSPSCKLESSHFTRFPHHPSNVPQFRCSSLSLPPSLPPPPPPRPDSRVPIPTCINNMLVCTCIMTIPVNTPTKMGGRGGSRSPSPRWRATGDQWLLRKR